MSQLDEPLESNGLFSLQNYSSHLFKYPVQTPLSPEIIAPLLL
jgi:hypothetical protein